MANFDFTWNNANKPAGAFFARKRQIKPTSGSTVKSNETLTKTQVTLARNDNVIKAKETKIHPKPKATESEGNPATISHLSHEEKTEDSNPVGYVKRKQKKDRKLGIADKNTSTSKSYSLFAHSHKDVYVDTNVFGKSLVEKVFHGDKCFGDLGLHDYLVSNLEKAGYTKLTNVQNKAIPALIAGKNLLIRSQTGSGKTLTFAVPILNALQTVNPRLQRADGVQALIIAPTRELALQIHEQFNKINTFQWIVIGHLCGGENRKTEKERLRKGCHVLIGTPGRLLDHVLHTQAFKLNNVKFLVLDEADRLLDMGFKKDIEKVVSEIDAATNDTGYNPMAMLKGEQSKTEPCDNKSKTRQTIFLSATMNKNLSELADFAMKEHDYIDALDGDLVVNNSSKDMIIPHTVKQEFILTYIKHRLFTLSALLLSLRESKVFVFMATTQMVEYHYELFTRCLKSSDEDDDDDDDDEEDLKFFKLHGSMDQSVRKEVFAGFRKAVKGILLCTDVVARGIDVPEADCIIQYTGPQSDQDYLHRVGRTGRAGKTGSAIIFLTHEEQDYIKRLQDQRVFLKKKLPETVMNNLCEFVGEFEEQAAATEMQRRYEETVEKDRNLQRMACFAYSSWSRFYNAYPSNMKDVFNFKRINLGHYVTSFALKETPSSISKIVKRQIGNREPKRLNKKLETGSQDLPVNTPVKRKIKSISLTTSEFSSGLEPSKKKKKKTNK